MKRPQKSRGGRSTTDTFERSISEHLPLTFTHWSMASENHPERNEDTFLADQRRGLVAVFDGVGGSTAGEREIKRVNY